MWHNLVVDVDVVAGLEQLVLPELALGMAITQQILVNADLGFETTKVIPVGTRLTSRTPCFFRARIPASVGVFVGKIFGRFLFQPIFIFSAVRKFLIVNFEEHFSTGTFSVHRKHPV